MNYSNQFSVNNNSFFNNNQKKITDWYNTTSMEIDHTNEKKNKKSKKNNEDLENKINIINNKLDQINLKLDNNKLNIIHQNINCSGCNKFTITGTRYKCLFCDNYNLCSDCELSLNKINSNVRHFENHFFIKINDTPLFNQIFPQYLQAVKNSK